MSSKNKPVELVSASEKDQVSKNLLDFLNTFPDLPVSISSIDYEFMDADTTGMTISIIPGAYIAERFIHGPYIAEYQFTIIYRTKPSSRNKRLSADELLDRLGDWASGQKPFIGEMMEVQTLEKVDRSSLFARMEGGWEDHQIPMRMTYLVNAEM